uniref:zinc finger protein 280D n=1 Tax=Euleptes europaea TaxID=460621 RepID=UPI0025412B85|nr:zinc finger protein 280D [Euleptes europaea]
MAELFMECEEEELEPWQQKPKPIVVDDEDDDDEPIFVGEIMSSKPANTYILNRVNPGSTRVAVQNGTPKRGFQPMGRLAASTLAVQPQPRAGSLSGTLPGLQKPLPGSSPPQEAAKPSAGISQPIGRSAPTPSRNLNVPVMAQSPARPVATVTAQPVALNRVPPSNTSSLVFGLRPSSGAPQGPGGAALTATGLSKRPAPSEGNSVSSKKAKAEETGSGSSSPVLPSVRSPNEVSSLQKGMASGNTKNGAPFPQACPKCNIHFNLLDPLKNHMKYCCPDLGHSYQGASTADSSGASAKMAESERGKLIMLVNDFYYGNYEGNVQQVNQEQKTHTTFKCASCMKLLKNNIRFMNHMKHHLELEKQNSESWESHTTCQHCYRQFPTPFQLQCHIESTHTPYESSTICRICELSFESEQILLQHMKDNHKPGEMPYVCQVCNYRSSAFSDVEKHFRAVHENTKNLLCPFCLKVIKIGAPYMHHYMRHQKKGVHRCTKCRLQFLTCKEKMDHKSQHHRTFRKPPQLEGLPPGTKVTIRASLGSIPPGSAATPLVGTSTSTLPMSPNVKTTNTKNYSKLNVTKAKPKLKPWGAQKRQSPGLSSLSSDSSSSSNKKNNKIANTALSSLRCPDIQKCIECSADIRTFASHFPAYVHCSLCRYGTSCSKAYVNHMMSFHSARQNKRFWIYKAHSEELRGMTTVCLNCDFVMDDSGFDKMAAHLNESRSHRCQVIVEKASSKDVATEDLPDQTNNTSLSKEGEDKSQVLSRPVTPEGHEGTSAPGSSEMKSSAEGTDKDPLGQGEETSSADKGEEKASLPSQGDSSSPASSAPSKDPPEEGGEGGLGGDLAEGLAMAGSEEVAPPSALGPSSGLGDQASSEDSSESGEMEQSGNQLAEGAVAAEGGENPPPSILERSSGPGLSDCLEDPREIPEEGSLIIRPLAEGAVAAEDGENPPPSVLDHPSGPGLSDCSEDPRETPEEGSLIIRPLAEGAVAAEDGENPPRSVLDHLSGPGLSDCSEDPRETPEEGSLIIRPLAEEAVAAEDGENPPPSVLDHLSGPGLSDCSEDPRETPEEGSLIIRPLAEGALAAEDGENPPPSVLDHLSGPGLSDCSEDPRETPEEGSLIDPLAEGAVAAEDGENPPPSVLDHPSGPGLSDCSEDPRETPEERSLTDPLAEGAVAAEGGENPPPSVPGHSTSPGLAARAEDLEASAGEGNAGSREDQVAESSTVDECEGNTSVVEHSSGLALSACSEDLGASAEETPCFGSPMDEDCAAAPCAENVAPALDSSSSPGLSVCSEDSRKTAEENQGDNPEGEVKETSAVAECSDQMSALLLGSSDARVPAPLKGSAEAAAKGSPGNQAAAAAPGEESSPAPSAGDGSCPVVQPCSVEPSHNKGAECDDSATGDHAGEKISQQPTGEDTGPGSEDRQQQQESDLEEAGLEEVDADSASQPPDSDVSFEQFLRRRGEPESASSDVSEQGSVHLEPLTPSEVLEHEATEILQKGGSVASSAKASGPGCEPAEAGASGEGSPAHGEAAASPAQESEDAS